LHGQLLAAPSSLDLSGHGRVLLDKGFATAQLSGQTDSGLMRWTHFSMRKHLIPLLIALAFGALVR
jgi:hypothetical protein